MALDVPVEQRSKPRHEGAAGNALEQARDDHGVRLTPLRWRPEPRSESPRSGPLQWPDLGFRATSLPTKEPRHLPLR
jgi:hypothetical protein